MKFLMFLTVWLIEFVIVTNAGVSMHNPFYCYSTDPIRSTKVMHSTWTSYEAIRSFNFTTVDPEISSMILAVY